MSAESPRKTCRQGGHVVAPHPVSDRSIIESVAGFINEVVPQGYTSTPVSENKEMITWARFEYGDINDPALYPDTTDDRNCTAPLLLVLGYGSGVQVWAIPASGEAIEVLSWRQGVVRTLRVLPTPSTDSLNPDTFAHKRPLVALCDSASPGPQFCSLSFISLRAGDQVKSIKFKNPVCDVLANRRSVVVSFSERIAVFDASTLEDRLTITTCYPCPGPNPNPIALGARWLAYAERKLISSKRCSGGTEGEGIQSYTATVLHAAKSLGKGLRELGETVASSLTGGVNPPGSRAVGPSLTGQSDTEVMHPGVVTIVDAQGTWKENGRMEDNVIAHFAAHGEAIVALQFDPSGILLVTADKRGHDFHLFRIQPHPGGSALAAIHHLYVLHRGDTTAKVQDIAFASDSRWVAVSTVRGTTHVFPITPYGGAVGLRTHSTPHVVNQLSRFHRSAGLTADGRNSPQPNTQAPESPLVQAMPYPNPRLPPYPHPTLVSPLAQIRQPIMHLSTPSSPNPSNAYHRNPSVRALGRNQSSSDDGGGIPLRVSACFAPSRAWLVGSPSVPRDSSNRSHKKSVDSLFIMACHGNLIEYDLETKHAAGIPKEKVCDDTAIELEVQAKAQWLLLRPPHSTEVSPPLPANNPLMVLPPSLPSHTHATRDVSSSYESDERWLSHVEIVTHAGPHRRLWMGPQFTFKTYSANAIPTPLEADGVDVGSGNRLTRSNPVNMPLSSTTRPIVPFLIESGSGGSYEQSPRLLEVYGGSAGDSDGSVGQGETQLREELADAMMESPGLPTRDTGRRVIVELRGGKRSHAIPIEMIVNPVGSVLSVLTDEGLRPDGKSSDGDNLETTAVRWPTDVVKAKAYSCDIETTINPENVSLFVSCDGTIEPLIEEPSKMEISNNHINHPWKTSSIGEESGLDLKPIVDVDAMKLPVTSNKGNRSKDAKNRDKLSAKPLPTERKTDVNKRKGKHDSVKSTKVVESFKANDSLKLAEVEVLAKSKPVTLSEKESDSLTEMRVYCRKLSTSSKSTNCSQEKSENVIATHMDSPASITSTESFASFVDESDQMCNDRTRTVDERNLPEMPFNTNEAEHAHESNAVLIDAVEIPSVIQESVRRKTYAKLALDLPDDEETLEMPMEYDCRGFMETSAKNYIDDQTKQLDSETEIQIKSSIKKNKSNDLPTQDVDEGRQDNLAVKSKSVRKQRKCDLMLDVDKEFETELNASQYVGKQMTDEDALVANITRVRSRKYQGLNLEDIKDLSLEQGTSSKQTFKETFRPAGLSNDSSIRLDFDSDEKFRKEKSPFGDFPDLIIPKPLTDSIEKKVQETQREEVPDKELKESQSSLDKMSVSPPTLWSSIASGKTKLATQPSQCVDTSSDLLLENLDSKQLTEYISSEVTIGSEITYPALEGVTNNDDEALATSQTSKKNKKKNKKRR